MHACSLLKGRTNKRRGGVGGGVQLFTWRFLGCRHFVVRRHWRRDGEKNKTKQKTMPYFTLWISGDSWSSCPRGFLLRCSRRAVLFFMPFSCVALFREDVQDCRSSSDANSFILPFPTQSLMPLLYCFSPPSLQRKMGSEVFWFLFIMSVCFFSMHWNITFELCGHL